VYHVLQVCKATVTGFVGLQNFFIQVKHKIKIEEKRQIILLALIWSSDFPKCFESLLRYFVKVPNVDQFSNPNLT
jgi:hypothetical protein